MITTTHVKNLLLGKNISRTSSVTATDPGASTYAVDGEIVVVSMDGTVLTTSTVVNYDTIRIMQSRGATKAPIYSDPIVRKNVTEYKIKSYTAAVEQTSYIGYNGTSGSIEVINNNQYMGRILMQGEQNTFGNRDMYKTFEYMSDSSAAQSEIAAGIAKSLYNNFKKHPDQYATFAAVCSDAGSAVGAAADTVVGSKGSIYVTITDTGSNNTCNAIAVGDFFRAGTAVTDPVYKVVASTATSTAGGVLTLDMPLQAAVNLVGNTAEFITAALAASANFGVKIVGYPKTYSAGKFRYYKNRFKIQLTDFGTTDITYTTGASEGSGTTEQIQDLEWLVQDGNMYRVSVPPFTQRADAVNYLSTGAGWSQMIIKHYEQSNGGIGATERSLKELIVAFAASAAGAGNVGTQATDNTNGVVDVIDEWLAVGTNAPGFATQEANI